MLLCFQVEAMQALQQEATLQLEAAATTLYDINDTTTSSINKQCHQFAEQALASATTHVTDISANVSKCSEQLLSIELSAMESRLRNGLPLLVPVAATTTTSSSSGSITTTTTNSRIVSNNNNSSGIEHVDTIQLQQLTLCSNMSFYLELNYSYYGTSAL